MGGKLINLFFEVWYYGMIWFFPVLLIGVLLALWWL